MSNCQRCGSDRIFSVGGKSSDCNSWNWRGKEGDGYIPRIPGIGGGDYYDLDVCLECGQLQGKWPQPIPEELEEEEDPSVQVEMDVGDICDGSRAALERRADEASGVGCLLELVDEGPYPRCSLYGPRNLIRLLLSSWSFDDFSIEEMFEAST